MHVPRAKPHRMWGIIGFARNARRASIHLPGKRSVPIAARASQRHGARRAGRATLLIGGLLQVQCPRPRHSDRFRLVLTRAARHAAAWRKKCERSFEARLTKEMSHSGDWVQKLRRSSRILGWTRRSPNCKATSRIFPFRSPTRGRVKALSQRDRVWLIPIREARSG